ncbi:Hypothetical predicted protein, partial [Mytilus galloprovincialis]
GATPYHLAAREDRDDSKYRKKRKKEVMDYLKTLMSKEEQEATLVSQQKDASPVVRG